VTQLTRPQHRALRQPGRGALRRARDAWDESSADAL